MGKDSQLFQYARIPGPDGLSYITTTILFDPEKDGYLNILHISDLHFGPGHWDGNDLELLEKLNSFNADIIINTGDNTTDGLEDEVHQAGIFLKGINCRNVISTLGNHDKRNRRSHELFHTYIDDSEVVKIPETSKTSKKHLFLNRETTKVNEYFTDINFIKSIEVNNQKVLIINIDSNEMYNDDGYVEKEVLNEVSRIINQIDYDIPLLMTHYSILGTDECPLKNSAVLIDFVQEHHIKFVFCGHTHELELMKTKDLYEGFSFSQFMCGSLSSRNLPRDDNMFLYYENMGSKEMHIYLYRIFQNGGVISFKEEKVC